MIPPNEKLMLSYINHAGELKNAEIRTLLESALAKPTVVAVIARRGKNSTMRFLMLTSFANAVNNKMYERIYSV